MGKGYLIDTNVIIGYLDGKIENKGMSFLHPIIDRIPNISVINKIEILRFNSPDNDYKTLVEFINSSYVFSLNENIIEKTISICRANKIKLPDAIIAATALVNNFTLITRNTSDFKKIADLDFLNPWEIS
ncbi:type II toxin-antitoxin system VapC family toxin [Pedobacter sp. CFBP9032]|uniref:type II toxin-antitoxin system VapC family toxin n=1 Tax=Pedobacter sp. CFBP9032 TaxID=3096539 RepID=UPI002A6B246C|nr:type II toxin-antitoxin system VapC family toxin [Pedobacter sp. CFBP9032]MDY0903719.1 type II toxin-antitoxin system VapC family toxin [Pedobacter sp. CFBP9032]